MPPRSLPAAAFEDIAFWDARYSVDDAAFDWYDAPSIGAAMAAVERALLLSPPSARSVPAAGAAQTFSLLDIGCGTSVLAERIAEDSRLFGRIVACDASEVAIEKQRQRQAERAEKRRHAAAAAAAAARAAEEAAAGEGGRGEGEPGPSVSFEVADALGLPYGDGSFDAVVDKGTADALDCAGCGGGAQEEDGEQGGEKVPATRVISEATRVLRPGGVFVMVSCREPWRRKKDFASAREMASSSSSSSSWTAAAAAAGTAGEEPAVLVLSSIVAEIRKGAKDPCPNAHVYVAVKSRPSSSGGGREGEREGAAAAAGALADAAARAASAAAAASTTEG